MGIIDFVDKGFENAVKTVLGTKKKRLTQEDINLIRKSRIFRKAARNC